MAELQDGTIESKNRNSAILPFCNPAIPPRSPSEYVARLDLRGREAEGEHQHRKDGEAEARAVERRLFVEHARMVATESERHDTHQAGQEPPADIEVGEPAGDANGE